MSNRIEQARSLIRLASSAVWLVTLLRALRASIRKERAQRDGDTPPANSPADLGDALREAGQRVKTRMQEVAEQARAEQARKAARKGD